MGTFWIKNMKLFFSSTNIFSQFSLQKFSQSYNSRIEYVNTFSSRSDHTRPKHRSCYWIAENQTLKYCFVQAINPEDREKYVSLCKKILKKDSKILLAVFEHSLEKGPPYAFKKEDVVKLYGGEEEFEYKQQPKQVFPQLENFVYLLTKLKWLTTIILN